MTPMELAARARHWIRDRDRRFASAFGGKRAWLRHRLARAADALGAFRPFRAIDWGRVSRLVFVCQGNICRSPYAEARARALSLDAASFGLAVLGPTSADPTAVRVARARGMDLTAHRARSTWELEIVPGDLLIAMEPRQAWRLRSRFARSGAQVTLLGLWCPDLRPHIQDPYGLAEDYFATCFRSIDGAIGVIASRLAGKGRGAAGGRSSHTSWRETCPVLVPDAHAMGSIAVIRSLGRAGYPVHASASHPTALGLRSRWARVSAAGPHYADPGFVPWLDRYLRTHAIEAIIPSEGLLLAVKPVFSDFARFFPVSDDPDVLYTGLSKCEVFRALLGAVDPDVARHLPPTILVDLGADLPARDQLDKLGPPFYVKVDARSGRSAAVYRALTVEAALQRLEELRPHFTHALVQGHVPGRGVGAFFLLWNGEPIGEFMHLRLHEVPHTGGVSSLRESWWHPRIRDDALRKLRALRWHGVAMMEYRWDLATDEFHFIEMNGRFWGSLHLALHAGVDFPCLLLDAFHGHLPARAPSFPLGVRCRWTFPKEVQYVWSRLKDRELGVRSRVWPALEFVWLSCDPRVKSDLLFRGDRRLYWHGLKRFLTTLS